MDLLFREIAQALLLGGVVVLHFVRVLGAVIQGASLPPRLEA
jgi:hypothetical protein